MSVLTTKPQFLYPHSRQFPFDEVAEKIVRAIEKRNWSVPGITLEFDIYGSGEAKYQLVREIIGNDFKLRFCRIQGKLSGYNDTAALRTINIPKQELTVYEDESGPRFLLYVGEDWEADKDWFMNSIKVNAKLRGEPRRYLRYSGNRRSRRSEFLATDCDLGREYSPIGDEPTQFNLEQKFGEFASWLEENVLNYILSFPEADIIHPLTSPEELVLYKGPWKVVYSLCPDRDIWRIKQGKRNPSILSPEERHAGFGHYRRLVPLHAVCDDKLPETVYQGFIWCDPEQRDKVTQETRLLSRVESSMAGIFGTDWIVTIRPKYANQVYVVDHSVYTETRRRLAEAIAPRDLFTYEEVDSIYAALGTTIVPITEYQGNYKEPMVLIGRELEFEEIESILRR